MGLDLNGEQSILHQSEIELADWAGSRSARVLDALGPLLGRFRNPSKIQPDSLTSLADCLRALLEERRALAGESALASLLGERFGGPRTATAELSPFCAWAEQAGPVARQVASVLKGGWPAEAAAHIRRLLEALYRAESIVSELCEPSPHRRRPFHGSPSGRGRWRLLRAGRCGPGGLVQPSCASLCASGTGGKGSHALVAYRLEAGTLDGLAAQLEALAARKLAKATYAEHEEKLSRYTGSRLDELQSTLARRDKEIIKLARKQLRWKYRLLLARLTATAWARNPPGHRWHS